MKSDAASEAAKNDSGILENDQRFRQPTHGAQEISDSDKLKVALTNLLA
jgi:hypothetical protein